MSKWNWREVASLLGAGLIAAGIVTWSLLTPLQLRVPSGQQRTIAADGQRTEPQRAPNEDVLLGDRLAPGVEALTGVAALLVSIWAVWLVRGTLIEARKATVAANKAAEAATKANAGFESSSKAELRAYVGSEGIVDLEIRQDASARVKLQMRNFGDTPAFRVRTRFNVGWRPLPLDEAAFATDVPLASDAVESITSLFPTTGQGVDVQTKGGVLGGHALYEQGRVALVVFGRIRYEDIFGQEHTTRIRMYRTFDMLPGIMRHHSGGNEAD